MKKILNVSKNQNAVTPEAAFKMLLGKTMGRKCDVIIQEGTLKQITLRENKEIFFEDVAVTTKEAVRKIIERAKCESCDNCECLMSLIDKEKTYE